MTKRGFYRTGQAARMLKRSPHLTRRLCETGLLRAELGPGGHWRIPASEVARLQKEGIPLIPSVADCSELAGDEIKNDCHPIIEEDLPNELTAPSSPSSISSDEEAQVARNRLQRTVIPKHVGSETDWPHEGDHQRAENCAATAQAHIGQEAASQAARERLQWHHRWLGWALDRLPPGIPEEYRLEVAQEVGQVLHGHQPQAPDLLTSRLVEGAVQKVLRPWRNAQETEMVLNIALGQLPSSTRSSSQATTWQIRAKEEANGAISRLRDGASFAAKLEAAMAAVRKIALEFEETSLRQRIVDEAILLPLLSSTEQEDARAAVRTCVESSRPGSTEAELRRARRAALQPFADTQRQREDRQRFERKVDQALNYIRPYLNQLWADGKLEGPENETAVWSYADEIRDDVHADLLEELEDTPEVSDQDIREMIEDIVDDLLQ